MTRIIRVPTSLFEGLNRYLKVEAAKRGLKKCEMEMLVVEKDMINVVLGDIGNGYKHPKKKKNKYFDLSF